MQMVRHKHIFVEAIVAAITTAHQLLNHSFGNTILAENLPALPAVRGHKIDTGLVNSANDATHRNLQGLKPLTGGAQKCRG